MQRSALVLLLLFALLFAQHGVARAQAAAAQPEQQHGGTANDWRLGRVTYFGAPESVAAAYDPTRGAGSFGILAFGSCGYTNSDGSLPFPRDQPAAAADASPDYPGSCGRCYLIRCVDNTKVLDNQGRPIRIINGTYEGDRFRPVLYDIDARVADTAGRRFPGNPDVERGEQTTLCRADTRGQSFLVRITDSCPCTQVLKAGAPGVSKDETRTQTWCCGTQGGLQHFDVAYWVFEQLAHPVFGVAMIEWRPVDCDSKEPLPQAYIDRSTIFSGGPRPGWSWQPYSASGATLITPAAVDPDGKPTTCLTISPGGGLAFKCRDCYKPGFQPFRGATAISFFIHSAATSSSPFESSTPQGMLPGLKLILKKAETGNYCKAEPTTSDASVVATGGGAGSGGSSNVSTTPQAVAAPGSWWRVRVPTVSFDCAGGGISLADVDQFDLQNTNERNAIICLGGITVEHGS